MPEALAFERPGWRLLWWHKKRQIKSWFEQALVRLISPILDKPLGRWLLPRLPTVLACSPFKGLDYMASWQSADLLSQHPRERARIAGRHVITDIVRRAAYPHYTPHAAGIARIRKVKWQDPKNLLPRATSTPTMICLTHTGEYALALGCVANQFSEPTEFILPAQRWEQDGKEEALRASETLGHTIELIDIDGPGASLSIARGLKRGKRLMIFADIPISIGMQWYGAPMPATFFGRPALLVRSPVQLAAKFGLNILLAGHRIHLGDEGSMHAFGWIDAGDAQTMGRELARAMEGFIRESPENWHYLPLLDLFFQHHVSPSALQPAIPAWLQPGAAPQE